MRGVALLLLGVLLAIAIGGAAPAGAQQSAPLAALACASDGSSVQFPLSATAGGPLLLGAATVPNAQLSSGEPRVAVACQAVFEAPAAPDPFVLSTGTITFSVSGPGIITETSGQTFVVPCGAGGCPGADAAAGSATADPSLIVHVAQQPGSFIPLGGQPAAITVSATYQPADGSAGAAATAAIDLVPAAIRMEFGAQPQRSRTGAYDSVQLTVQLFSLLPDGCALLGTGQFITCTDPVSQSTQPGVEPGTVTLTTTLGTFANGAQQMQLGCGVPPSSLPLVPEAGVAQPYPLACQSMTVNVELAGRAGTAAFTAAFVGLYTGAQAGTQAQTTIAPEPPSYRLVPGCTQVEAPLELPASAPAQVVAESVTPPDAVVSIWRMDAASGVWQAGYARDPAMPLNFTTVTPGETLFVCVDALASYPLH